MRKRKECKKIVCVTIEPKQKRNLKGLAKYLGLNVSEVIRELLPSTEEIDAFKAYQKDVYDKDVLLWLFVKARREFIEKLMIKHPLHPLHLQTVAVSYFDEEDGIKIFKLYQKFMKASWKIKGYRFESIMVKVGEGKKKKFRIVLGPGDEKETVGKLIVKFFMCDYSVRVGDRMYYAQYFLNEG